MRLISSLLKRVVYPCLWSTGYFRRHAHHGQLSVVTYHGVRPEGYVSRDAVMDGNLIPAETFRAQLRLLKNRYHVISPESLLSWLRNEEPLPPFSVLLTCDDGLQNVLTDMVPILQEEGVRCLFFVTGASAGESRTMLWYEELFLLFLGAPPGRFEISSEGVAIHGELGSRKERRAIWWNSVKRLSQVDAGSRASFLRTMRIQFGLGSWQCFDPGDPAACRRFGLLTCAELRELDLAGMTVGAHTMSHPLLSQSPPELAWAEIVESRARLEAALEKRVWAFAYPFGDAQSVTPQVLDMAKDAGYAAAFLNFGGGLGTDLPVYAMPRVHVTAQMNLAEFEAHVSGFYQRLQRRTGRGSQGLGIAKDR